MKYGDTFEFEGHKLILKEINECYGCFFEEKGSCPECQGKGIWVEDDKTPDLKYMNPGYDVLALSFMVKDQMGRLFEDCEKLALTCIMPYCDYPNSKEGLNGLLYAITNTRIAVKESKDVIEKILFSPAKPDSGYITTAMKRVLDLVRGGLRKLKSAKSDSLRRAATKSTR